jgi:phosphomannomutase
MGGLSAETKNGKRDAIRVGMSIFKTYDIRGIYNQEWERDTAYRIGRFLPSLLGARDVLIGRDARLSSDEIRDALSSGILDSGCNVTDVGLCSTPALYFATAHYGYRASVMITASHNPPQYNGLKISGENAVPVGYSTGLNRLEKMVEARVKSTHSRGTLTPKDIRRDYLAHLSRFKEGIRDIKAIVDCSNGMAGVFIHDIVENLDADITLMYDIPDGRFPNHDPNPLVEENLSDLKARVRELNADLGVCFDGDGDRVMFVDENGRFVSPDLITALLGLYYFVYFPARREGSKVVLYDVRSSRSVVEEITRLGGSPVICQVGHSYAKKLLRETKGIFGGELAGHYYFKENYYCDSGIIAALLVLSILSKERLLLSEFVHRVQKYFFSGEINFEVREKEKIIQNLICDYYDGELTDIDGIRVDYPSWWFNVRPSNTEPYLRLVVEATTSDELLERTQELKEKIRKYDS